MTTTETMPLPDRIRELIRAANDALACVEGGMRISDPLLGDIQGTEETVCRELADAAMAVLNPLYGEDLAARLRLQLDELEADIRSDATGGATMWDQPAADVIADAKAEIIRVARWCGPDWPVGPGAFRWWPRRPVRAWSQ